jgi:hypothetical protein
VRNGKEVNQYGFVFNCLLYLHTHILKCEGIKMTKRLRIGKIEKRIIKEEMEMYLGKRT